MESIVIGGKEYTFVKTRNHMPVSVYRGEEGYLRIGPEELIKGEIENHRTLARFGFPVATILEEGEHVGRYYFIESSLGDDNFSTIFKRNLTAEHTIADADFERLLQIGVHFVEAQMKTKDSVRYNPANFEKIIKYEILLKELPHLAEKTAVAMKKIHERIKDLPIVVAHGDFNPHNIHEGGVIDWERATEAPFGYDIATCISQIFFFPIAGDFEFTGGYRFTKKQIEAYWREIDAIAERTTFPKPSLYANDFIFCRCVWSVVRMDRWPKIQQWRNDQYAAILAAYLEGKNLGEVLMNFVREGYF